MPKWAVIDTNGSACPIRRETHLPASLGGAIRDRSSLHLALDPKPVLEAQTGECPSWHVAAVHVEARERVGYSELSGVELPWRGHRGAL